MKEESSIDCISPWLHYKVCFIQALKVQFYFQIWALCLPSSLLLSICPQRATCPSVLASTPFLSTNSIHPSLCPSSWMQTQAFQWLSSSFWLKSCGWSPGATVTRCWLAVVALVWATQLPDSLSPIWIVLIIPSVWLGNPSVCQSRTFSFLIMFFSLVCWSGELKMYLWEQRNMIQAVHCRQDQKKKQFLEFVQKLWHYVLNLTHVRRKGRKWVIVTSEPTAMNTKQKHMLCVCI